jgi:hypothetical protein
VNSGIVLALDDAVLLVLVEKLPALAGVAATAAGRVGIVLDDLVDELAAPRERLNRRVALQRAQVEPAVAIAIGRVSRAGPPVDAIRAAGPSVGRGRVVGLLRVNDRSHAARVVDDEQNVRLDAGTGARRDEQLRVVRLRGQARNEHPERAHGHGKQPGFGDVHNDSFVLKLCFLGANVYYWR